MLGAKGIIKWQCVEVLRKIFFNHVGIDGTCRRIYKQALMLSTAICFVVNVLEFWCHF